MVCTVKGMIHNIRNFAGPIPAQKCWLSYETKIIYKKAQNVRTCWRASKRSKDDEPVYQGHKKESPATLKQHWDGDLPAPDLTLLHGRLSADHIVVTRAINLYAVY
jgi:hypothetical protein